MMHLYPDVPTQTLAYSRSSMAKPRPIRIRDPSDLSQLFFYDDDDDDDNDGNSSTGAAAMPTIAEPYMGPIAVVTTCLGGRGRGVTAQRAIAAGECLFVVAPTATPDLLVVAQEWCEQISGEDTSSTASSSLLERLTEQALLRSMRQACEEGQNNDEQNAIAQSILALEGSGSSHNIGDDDDSAALVTDTNILVGKAPTIRRPLPPVSDEQLLQVIRRNAFGPDAMLSYRSVEARWSGSSPTKKHASSSNVWLPPRLLGLYPLAAMLNHACVGNAVRVFVGNIMVVHASADIPAGAEIVWSYVPVTTPYTSRRAQLTQTHGFECQCARCQAEQAGYQTNDNDDDDDDDDTAKSLRRLDHDLETKWSSSITTTDAEIAEAVDALEGDILQRSQLSNEVRRYLRIGAAQLYILHLNRSLANLQSSTSSSSIGDVRTERERLLTLCLQLHLCFATSNRASTEHLSLLFVGYELISAIHTMAANDNTNPSKTLPKLRFWTEQVKQAILVRYGNLGENLETVRDMMKHARSVVRVQDGIYRVRHTFI